MIYYTRVKSRPLGKNNANNILIVIRIHSNNMK